MCMSLWDCRVFRVIVGRRNHTEHLHYNDDRAIQSLFSGLKFAACWLLGNFFGVNFFGVTNFAVTFLKLGLFLRGVTKSVTKGSHFHASVVSLIYKGKSHTNEKETFFGVTFNFFRSGFNLIWFFWVLTSPTSLSWLSTPLHLYTKAHPSLSLGSATTSYTQITFMQCYSHSTKDYNRVQGLTLHFISVLSKWK